LYASDRYALLVVLQGMDTAGKDSAIRHVVSGVNPQGCEVTSFKTPSASELQHDFLWRAVGRLPGRGRIGIFNRSYYEEVLIARVHPELLTAEGWANDVAAGPDDWIWMSRYRSINDLERHLHANGTRIAKIFLHLSKAEQKKRLLARLDDDAKIWKFSEADLTERKVWDAYMTAYAQALAATGTEPAPWYVVPADDKATARLIVSAILIDALEAMALSMPKVGEARRRELSSLRARLAGDDA
jgi:PPK2 family polyphosphate:nucleotide phosphotransferase